MKNLITIGIDVGGSHITAGLVDLKSREIVENTVIRESLNSQDELEKILSVWTSVIKGVAAFSPGSHVKLGIAMPGPFDYEEGISMIAGQNKFDAFFGLNIKELLAEHLEISKQDILMMNDACCFLKGEVFGGAAMSYSNVIGLTLGTGLGSAKCSSSLTYDAELWCHPFVDGIVEDYLSARWFLKRYKELSGVDATGVKQLSDMAAYNNYASTVFEEFGVNLGLFLVKFIEMESPELVVLGGNIANAYSLFIENTLSILKLNSINTPLVRASLGEYAAIIGAASLWADSRELV